MSATARLNPRQTVDENRRQHVAEYAAYIAGKSLDNLRECEQIVAASLPYMTDPEDRETQQAKLQAVQTAIANARQ